MQLFSEVDQLRHELDLARLEISLLRKQLKETSFDRSASSLDTSKHRKSGSRNISENILLVDQSLPSGHTVESFLNEPFSEVADEHDTNVDQDTPLQTVEEFQADQIFKTLEIKENPALVELRRDTLIKTINNIFDLEYSPNNISKIKDEMKANGKLGIDK